MIAIEYQGKIYKIAKEPHENVEDTYKRGWFIIQNYDKYCYDELYSLSIMMINTSKGMSY